MRSLTEGSSSTASEASELKLGTSLSTAEVEAERLEDVLAAAAMASSSLTVRLSLTRSDKLLTVKKRLSKKVETKSTHVDLVETKSGNFST